jgi:hypothetical protein
MIKKLRNQPYATKWKQAPKWGQEEVKKWRIHINANGRHDFRIQEEINSGQYAILAINYIVIVKREKKDYLQDSN